MTTKRVFSYGSAAVVQSGSMFAIAAVAGFALPAHKFAELAYFQAWMMLAALIIDFGIGQAALRKSVVDQDVRIFLLSLRAKAVVGGLLVAALGVSAFYTGRWMDVAIGLCAALISINTTCRVYQAQVDDYKGLLSSSVVMVVFSVLGAAAAFLQEDWKIVALGAFMVPQLAMMLSRRSLIWPSLSGYRAREAVSSLAKFAPYLWLSGVMFSSVVPASLVILKRALDPASFSAFALASSFAGALGVLVTAFRTALYSRIVGVLVESDLSLRSAQEFLSSIWLFVVLHILGAILLGLLLHFGYEAEYPTVLPSSLILCSGALVAGGVGLFNIRYQAMGMKTLEIGINAGRLLTALGVVWVLGQSAVVAALLIATCMASFELLYTLCGESAYKMRKRLSI